MKTHPMAASLLVVLGLALFPRTTSLAADGPDKQEQQVNELLLNALNAVLSGTAEEVENRAKKGGKDAPVLLKDESKPGLGYHVYRQDGHRAYYHDGKMVRINVRGIKGVKDVLTKQTKPTKGPLYEWMQVPDKEAQERCHWSFQTIVEQNDGTAVVQVPWTYICEFTLHKDGSVTVSLIDASRAEKLHKALADK